MNLKKWLVFALGIIVSIVALYFIVQKIDVAASLKTLSQTPFYIPVLMVLIYLMGFLIRALRWKLMLQSVKKIYLKNLLASIVVGYGGNNFLPARGGELLRMEFFSRKAGIPRTISVTSVLTEKILDGLSLLFILIVFVGFFPSNLLEIGWFKNLFYLANLVFGGIVVFLFGLRIFSTHITGFLMDKSGIWKKINNILTDVLNAISFLKLNYNGLLILVLGILVWLIEGSMFVIAVNASLPQSNAWLVGYFTLVVLNFGILVPSSPGYVGVFQAMFILAFSVFHLPEEHALSVSLLVHLCQFLPITLWAILILLKSSFSVKKN